MGRQEMATWQSHFQFFFKRKSRQWKLKSGCETLHKNTKNRQLIKFSGHSSIFDNLNHAKFEQTKGGGTPNLSG